MRGERLGGPVDASSCRRRGPPSGSAASLPGLRLAVLAVALAGVVAPGGRGVGKPAFVTFNTVCAQCHEAECSGRFTFAGGAAAAREHVRRYAGQIPDAEVEDLFELLGRTKQECSVYPMPEDAPPGAVWTAAALRSLYEPRARAYYVPLGSPPSGRCRLELELDADTDVTASVTDARFERVHEHAGLSHGRRIETDWVCRGAGPYYVRLTIGSDAQLRALRIDSGGAAE